MFAVLLGLAHFGAVEASMDIAMYLDRSLVYIGLKWLNITEQIDEQQIENGV